MSEPQGWEMEPTAILKDPAAHAKWLMNVAELLDAAGGVAPGEVQPTGPKVKAGGPKAKAKYIRREFRVSAVVRGETARRFREDSIALELPDSLLVGAILEAYYKVRAESVMGSTLGLSKGILRKS